LVSGRTVAVLLGGLVMLLAMFVLALSVGSETVPVSAVWNWLTGHGAGDDGLTTLLVEFHLPRALTAVAAGSGLAVVGLLMQTLFANPLADPYILGVSSGAGLGVALSVLGTGGAAAGFTAAFGSFGRWGTVVAAMIGSMLVLGLILLAGRWVRTVVSLLVIGVMVGSAVGALVSLLLAFADPARVQKFVLWSLGSLDGTYLGDMAVLLPVVAVGLLAALGISPSLNALLLGERYAASMGVRVRRIRAVAIAATALVCGVVTAFCGPIAFLGIAVPHLARVLLRRADHRLLVPACALLGAVVCLGCGVLASLPGTDGVLPLNVVTAVVGAPVVVIVLLRSRTMAAGQ